MASQKERGNDVLRKFVAVGMLLIVIDEYDLAEAAEAFTVALGLLAAKAGQKPSEILQASLETDMDKDWEEVVLARATQLKEEQEEHGK